MWKSSKNDFFVQIKTKGFFVGESIPERFFLVGNRNGMRTILHRSAMLVVVWYAHLSWNLEFERFLFQLKILMWKSWKSALFVQIKTKGIFVGESIPERFFLVGNRNGMRTILHKSAMLVVVGYAHLSWNLEFERFLFQLKIFMWKSSKNDFFVQIKTKGFCWGVNTWKVLSGGK